MSNVPTVSASGTGYLTLSQANKLFVSIGKFNSLGSNYVPYGANSSLSISVTSGNSTTALTATAPVGSSNILALYQASSQVLYVDNLGMLHVNPTINATYASQFTVLANGNGGLHLGMGANSGTGLYINMGSGAGIG